MPLVSTAPISVPLPGPSPLTIGLLTPHNPFDRRAFSGTAHFAMRALARQPHLTTRLLGGHRPPGLRDRLARRLGYTAAPPRLHPGALAGLDAVVGLVASDLLDALPPKMPFFHVTDATPDFLAEAYGWDIPDAAHIREARLARNASACLYSSEMMADRARAELNPREARAIPFGINMDLPPGDPPVKSAFAPLELVFVGADWTRKGGEIALGAVAHLGALGVPVHLTLVGNIPRHVASGPNVTRVGFLDKSRPREMRRLREIYARAHLMVLPTRGDCTPMVIAEAMAHGTPVLATRTGAIPEMLGGRGAGRLLPMEASAGDWARVIAEVIRDQAAYALMSDAAFDRARARYSWDAWATEVARSVAAQRADVARAA